MLACYSDSFMAAPAHPPTSPTPAALSALEPLVLEPLRHPVLAGVLAALLVVHAEAAEVEVVVSAVVDGLALEIPLAAGVLLAVPPEHLRRVRELPRPAGAVAIIVTLGLGAAAQSAERGRNE